MEPVEPASPAVDSSSVPEESNGTHLAVPADTVPLTIPADDNRLRLDFDISVSALGAKDITSGSFALVSGLRYNPTTQGLHLKDPELLDINLPNAGSLLSGGTRTLLNNVLVEYANEQPVYRLDGDLLRKLPAGKHIVSTDIENGLVVVRLEK